MRTNDEATNTTATSCKEDQWIAIVNKCVRVKAVSFRTLQVTALLLPGIDIRATAGGVRFIAALSNAGGVMPIPALRLIRRLFLRLSGSN